MPKRTMSRLSDFIGGRSLGEIYDAGWVPSVLQPFTEDYSDYIAPGSHVLDVVCGTGLMTLHAAGLAGPSGRAVGIDPTGPLLQMALQKAAPNPVEWHEIGVQAMPFEADSFDLVLCNQALQYMEDPESALDAMKKVVKTGGYILLSTWSPTEKQIPVNDFEKMIAKHISPEYSTIHAFTFGGMPRLKSLASAVDVNVVRAETIGRPTNYVSVAACVELMLGGAGRMLPDGTMAMGLFDPEDPIFARGVETLITELEVKWSSYTSEEGLTIPYYTDFIVLEK